MLAASLTLALSSSQPQTAQTPRRPTLTGNITTLKDFPSKILDNTRNVHVYLPPDYEKDTSEKDNQARYPVVYLHDGQNVFDGATSFIPGQEWRADETAESLIRARLLRPIILVAIDNKGAERANEFLPTRATYQNQEIGGKATLYTRFLVEELKPEIDRRYRTLPGPQNTAVVGSSFGGILSLHMGLTRPGVFGHVVAMSPSLWWDDRSMLKTLAAQKSPLPFRLWLDMGTDEGETHVKNAQETAEALKPHNPDPKRFTFLLDPHAGHNESAWSRRLAPALLWLFGPPVD